MFLMAKQNHALEVFFGYLVEVISRTSPPSGRYRFVLAKFEVTTQKTSGGELSVREVVDLALDRAILMSRVGATARLIIPQNLQHLFERKREP